MWGIKNVILNAARNALRRKGKERVVTKADFNYALILEENNKQNKITGFTQIKETLGKIGKQIGKQKGKKIGKI